MDFMEKFGVHSHEIKNKPSNIIAEDNSSASVLHQEKQLPKIAQNPLEGVSMAAFVCYYDYVGHPHSSIAEEVEKNEKWVGSLIKEAKEAGMYEDFINEFKEWLLLKGGDLPISENDEGGETA